MLRIFFIAVLFLAAGCRNSDVKTTYQNHRFDKQVMEQLPVYDSLVRLIVKNFASMQQLIKENGSFRYVDSSQRKSLSAKLPPEAAASVTQFFAKPGAGAMYGFEVYKDSTIKILIRDANLAYHFFVRERLSYYPDSSKMKRKEYPYKDTILNQNWQYWVLFDDQGAF